MTLLPYSIVKSAITLGASSSAAKKQEQPTQQFVVVQTLAHAATGPDGRHDPTVAYFTGKLRPDCPVREYIVPTSSPFLKSLEKTPHTVQNVEHITGDDCRPILKIKFPKSVSFVQLHEALAKAKIEGRVTRWGTIVAPSLTPAAERIFLSLGAELPSQRIAKAAAKKKEAKLADKAANAEQKKREQEAMPAKIIFTKVESALSPKECNFLLSLLKDKIKMDSKLLSVATHHFVVATSFDFGKAVADRWFVVGEARYFAEWEPSMLPLFLAQQQQQASIQAATAAAAAGSSGSGGVAVGDEEDAAPAAAASAPPSGPARM